MERKLPNYKEAVQMVVASDIQERLGIGVNCTACQYNRGKWCAAGDDKFEVCEAIHAQPKLWIEPPRWIPVTERPPKNTEQVLVTLADGEVTIDEYWSNAANKEDEGWGLDLVVAWMPLPEPYREEEKHEDH